MTMPNQMSNEATKLIARFGRMKTGKSFDTAMSDCMKNMTSGRISAEETQQVLRAAKKALRRFDAALKHEELALRHELRRKTK
jgi:hypothetical protein